MKTTTWIPLVLGCVLGLLDLLSWASDFSLPIGPYGATGPQEVFITMSAALGGPLGLSATCILHELGNFYFGLQSLFSQEQLSSTGVLYSIADVLAHILAALIVVYCYKLLHQRAKKVYIFFVGWILILVFYYTILVSLQFLLIGFVIDLPVLAVLLSSFLPEYLVVAIITTLIWIALPARYTRPLWYEAQPIVLPTEDIV